MKTSSLIKKLAAAGFTKGNSFAGQMGGNWQLWDNKTSLVKFLDGEEKTDHIVVDCKLAILDKLKMNCPVENTRGICSTWPQVEKVLEKHKKIADNYALEQVIKESPMVNRVEQEKKTTAAFVEAIAELSK